MIHTGFFPKNFNENSKIQQNFLMSGKAKRLKSYFFHEAFIGVNKGQQLFTCMVAEEIQLKMK